MVLDWRDVSVIKGGAHSSTTTNFSLCILPLQTPVGWNAGVSGSRRWRVTHTSATDTAPLQQACHTEQVQRKHPDTGSAGGFLLPEGKAGTPV